MFPDLRKKRFVGGPGVWPYVLFIDSVPNARTTELFYDLGTVPVLVKVEGKVRQPFR
jgi:hypothetical protein